METSGLYGTRRPRLAAGRQRRAELELKAGNKLLSCCGAPPPPEPLPESKRPPLAEPAAVLTGASLAGDLERVEKRLSEGASASAEASHHGGRPVALNAARAGHLEVLETLLRAGAELEATDKDGVTALMWASAKGHAGCAKALLDWGADIDAVSANGNTALIMAAMYGQLACAKLLLEAGANRSKKNADGNSALAEARAHRRATLGATGPVVTLLQTERGWLKKLR